MRPAGRAEHIVGGVHVGGPVAEGLVDGVLEGTRTVLHRHDLGAQSLHPEHVGALALDVDLAHVDGAVEAEFGRHGRGGHAVLSGTGLRDHAFFAHAAHEQALAHHVVGLVRARVVQVLALDENLRAAEVAGQVLGEGERRRPARVFAHEGFILAPECRVGLRLGEGRLEVAKGRHKDFGQVGAAEIAEVAARFAGKQRGGHHSRSSQGVPRRWPAYTPRSV